MFTLTFAVALLADPTPEQIARDYVRQRIDLVKLLDSATDRASADKAYPKVELLLMQCAMSQATLGKLQTEERDKAFAAAVAAEGEPPSLGEAYVRLATRFPVNGEFVPLAELAHEEVALRRIMALQKACDVYMLSPNNKARTCPAKLEELLKPFGGTSLLRNGPADLLDPWGKPYRYAVAKNKNGNDHIFIWTERTIDGKTRVIGERPAA